MKKMSATASSGFSLVELIMVVSIIGILSGLSMGYFSRNRQDEVLNSASKLIISFLEEARVRAIQQSSPCRALIRTNTKAISVTCGSDEKVAMALELSKEVSRAQSIMMTLSNPEESTWIFSPRGTTTSNGTIELTDPTTTQGRCIQLLGPIGFLRIGKLQGSRCNFATSY